MQTCSKCFIPKPLSDYYLRDKKSGKHHTQCKLCYKKHRQHYYTEHYDKYKESYRARAKARRESLRNEFRMNMLAYLSQQCCIDCGETDLRVLELDHVDPATKKFTVSQAVKLGYSWNEVLSEIKKCQVLCANCHKRRTAQQFDWYKSI